MVYSLTLVYATVISWSHTLAAASQQAAGLLPDRPAGRRGHVQFSGWRVVQSHQVEQPYLPDDKEIPYQLRARSHTMALINKTKFLNDADFIIRLLYKHSYWSRLNCSKPITTIGLLLLLSLVLSIITPTPLLHYFIVIRHFWHFCLYY